MDGWIVPLISIKGGGGKLAHDRRFVSNSLVESFFGISAILFEGEGGVEMFQRSRGRLGTRGKKKTRRIFELILGWIMSFYRFLIFRCSETDFTIFRKEREGGIVRRIVRGDERN